MRSLVGERVMPWADWSEWRELRDMVVNGETERACRRVDMYRLRRRNAVPISTISTVTLMRQLEKPHPDTYLQRLALSMTLTRLVNGTTDQLQPRGDNSIARSVYSLAVELKLPLILVEIRHQASHNALPRLSILESAAKRALAWLEEHYWKPQVKNIQSMCDDDIDGFKRVLDEVKDEERMEGSVLRLGSQLGSKVPDDKDAETGGSSSVLDKLKAVSEKLQSTRSQSVATIPLAESVPRKPQWALCTDFEAWKTTPLGLVPGQFRAPRIRDGVPKRHHRESSGTAGETPDEESDGSEEKVDDILQSDRKRPKPLECATPDRLKKARFTRDEEAYIAMKITEFGSLARGQPPADFHDKDEQSKQ